MRKRRITICLATWGVFALTTATSSKVDAASAESRVSWVEKDNVAAADGELAKDCSNCAGWGTSGAASAQEILSGSFSFQVPKNGHLVCGLSDAKLGNDFESVEHGIHVTPLGSVNVRESGIFRRTIVQSGHNPDSVLSIHRYGRLIEYRVDGVTKAKSKTTGSGRMVAHCALSTPGIKVTEATIRTVDLSDPRPLWVDQKQCRCQ